MSTSSRFFSHDLTSEELPGADSVIRWLAGKYTWSCRIKATTSEQFNTGVGPTAREINSMATETMDLTSEEAHEGQEGHSDEIPAAIQSISNLSDGMNNLELPSDPDAQATVTDFLDFTEYLPSDMMRSLTLIGNLDQKYIEASMNIHELTKLYGELPSLSGNKRVDLVQVRAEISQSLSEAVSARTLSHAEACRMADNVDRHYNRAKNIRSKLQAIAKTLPPSRDASPTCPQSSSPQVVRAPKLFVGADSARPSTTTVAPSMHKNRVQSVIIIPGDVMAPYGIGYEVFSSESDDWDSEEDEPVTPTLTPGPGRPIGSTAGRMKSIRIPRPPKAPKIPKIKVPKPPRAPRPPGVMGTNVHSAVAGISTSNALRECTPPPPGTIPGDPKHAPWFELTKYELALLRKRMKKNAVWSPSDTMILRELKHLGRGKDGYLQAKSKAEAAGEPFDDKLPATIYDASGRQVVAEGAINIDLLADADPGKNKGMKLNEAKKLKRENQAKELAKLAAEEAEESAHKLSEVASVIAGLFAKPSSKHGTNGNAKPAETPVKTPSRALARKRKRESTADTDGTKPEVEKSNKLVIKPQKRSKTETPVPAPQSVVTSSLNTLPVTSIPGESSTLSDAVSASTGISTATVPLRASSPKKSSTPILPPTKETKKDPKKEVKKPAVTATTGRRASAAPTPTPAPEVPPPRRPSSRPGSRPTSSGKAASVEPTPAIGKDRPRRASTVHNTPAPELHPIRATSKRAKRPAPGPVTAGVEGSAAVSVGKRTAAPRKKAGPKKQLKDEGKDTAEIWDEIDDEGNIIDPNEPRYCLCNRVSFGVMICCENADVSVSCIPLLSLFSIDQRPVREGMVSSGVCRPC
jgi:hypothetical protein